MKCGRRALGIRGEAEVVRLEHVNMVPPCAQFARNYGDKEAAPRPWSRHSEGECGRCSYIEGQGGGPPHISCGLPFIIVPGRTGGSR